MAEIPGLTSSRSGPPGAKGCRTATLCMPYNTCPGGQASASSGACIYAGRLCRCMQCHGAGVEKPGCVKAPRCLSVKHRCGHRGRGLSSECGRQQVIRFDDWQVASATSQRLACRQGFQTLLCVGTGARGHSLITDQLRHALWAVESKMPENLTMPENVLSNVQ